MPVRGYFSTKISQGDVLAIPPCTPLIYMYKIVYFDSLKAIIVQTPAKASMCSNRPVLTFASFVVTIIKLIITLNEI